jgi:hypothetical protein
LNLCAPASSSWLCRQQNTATGIIQGIRIPAPARIYDRLGLESLPLNLAALMATVTRTESVRATASNQVSTITSSKASFTACRRSAPCQWVAAAAATDSVTRVMILLRPGRQCQGHQVSDSESEVCSSSRFKFSESSTPSPPGLGRGYLPSRRGAARRHVVAGGTCSRRCHGGGKAGGRLTT